MMVYLKLFPRPLGPEPRLYFIKPPLAQVESIEVEPGYFIEDPWADYEIVEFSSEFMARLWLKANYPLTYQELKDS